MGCDRGVIGRHLSQCLFHLKLVCYADKRLSMRFVIFKEIITF